MISNDHLGLIQLKLLVLQLPPQLLPLIFLLNQLLRQLVVRLILFCQGVAALHAVVPAVSDMLTLYNLKCLCYMSRQENQLSICTTEVWSVNTVKLHSWSLGSNS